MNQSALDRAAAILFALLSAALIAAFFADSRFFHEDIARDIVRRIEKIERTSLYVNS